MGNAVGQVRFPDGEILFFLYSGTVDSANSRLWKDEFEFYDHWQGDHSQRCICGNSQEVDLATNYGSGIQWRGEACKRCGAITGGYEPHDNEYSYPKEGLPGWWTT